MDEILAWDSITFASTEYLYFPVFLSFINKLKPNNLNNSITCKGLSQLILQYLEVSNPENKSPCKFLPINCESGRWFKTQSFKSFSDCFNKDKFLCNLLFHLSLSSLIPQNSIYANTLTNSFSNEIAFNKSFSSNASNCFL